MSLAAKASLAAARELVRKRRGAPHGTPRVSIAQERAHQVTRMPFVTLNVAGGQKVPTALR